MEKIKFYRYLFLLSAIWNWVVALSLFFASIFILDIAAPIFGMEIPPSLVWFHVVLVLIFLFGVGFYLVSRDLTQNHAVVVIGILEKFSFFIALLIYFILGAINFLAFTLVIVDFVFGCLFLEFLINFSKTAK